MRAVNTLFPAPGQREWKIRIGSSVSPSSVKEPYRIFHSSDSLPPLRKPFPLRCRSESSGDVRKLKYARDRPNPVVPQRQALPQSSCAPAGDRRGNPAIFKLSKDFRKSRARSRRLPRINGDSDPFPNRTFL